MAAAQATGVFTLENRTVVDPHREGGVVDAVGHLGGGSAPGSLAQLPHDKKLVLFGSQRTDLCNPLRGPARPGEHDKGCGGRDGTRTHDPHDVNVVL